MPKFTQYQPGQFSWVDLVAHEMGPAIEFYGNLFGWQAVQQDTQGGPPYAIFTKNGQPVAGVGQMNSEMKAQGVPPMWNNYVNVEDAAATAKRVHDLGGQVTVPVTQILDAGWLAFFRDPQGATFAVWQKNKHHGAALANEPGSFTWNELMTRDVTAAKKFYGDLLGWQFEEMKHDNVIYNVIKNRGRENGGIMPMGDEFPSEIPDHWMAYFAVEDTDASCKQISSLGGNVCVPPTDIPNIGRFAVVNDPQGAVFTLIKLEKAPDA